MEQEQLIPADAICTHHHIEYTFIDSLQTAGLIEITTVEGRSYIHPEQLQDLEKFICFHYELDINLEGIEAIASLLERVKRLQEEVQQLKSRD
ncbi:MAG TPA: chaperone modulator CbpM [Chitinophagaceae bacterium]|nr:chaperone modulator CbpM [Chitinophagaceae bacterium]